MLLFGFSIGCLVGFIIAKIVGVSLSIGNLRIDNSDSLTRPYLFLELSKSTVINDICKRKYVVMKVLSKNYISHK